MQAFAEKGWTSSGLMKGDHTNYLDFIEGRR